MTFNFDAFLLAWFFMVLIAGAVPQVADWAFGDFAAVGSAVIILLMAIVVGMV